MHVFFSKYIKRTTTSLVFQGKGRQYQHLVATRRYYICNDVIQEFNYPVTGMVGREEDEESGDADEK